MCGLREAMAGPAVLRCNVAHCLGSKMRRGGVTEIPVPDRRDTVCRLESIGLAPEGFFTFLPLKLSHMCHCPPPSPTTPVP